MYVCIYIYIYIYISTTNHRIQPLVSQLSYLRGPCCMATCRYDIPFLRLSSRTTPRQLGHHSASNVTSHSLRPQGKRAAAKSKCPYFLVEWSVYFMISKKFSGSISFFGDPFFGGIGISTCCGSMIHPSWDDELGWSTRDQPGGLKPPEPDGSISEKAWISVKWPILWPQ